VAAIATLTAEVQALHVAAMPHLFRPPSEGLFPLARLRALLASADHVVLVAEVDGAVVGNAHAEVQRRAESPFRRATAVLHVHQMAVGGEWRGRGIGTRLLDAMRTAARERGIATLELNVWSFNAEAREFYARAGFVSAREIMVHDVDTSVDGDR
jgi:GNAT superfamily N-acetyltransferase